MKPIDNRNTTTPYYCSTETYILYIRCFKKGIFQGHGAVPYEEARDRFARLQAALITPFDIANPSMLLYCRVKAVY